MEIGSEERSPSHPDRDTVERSPLVQSVRTGARVLWAITAIAELGILARIIAMLAVGVNQDGTAHSHTATVVYAITGIFVGLFQSSADVHVPLNGLPHVLDVAGVLAMDALFFATLAITKVGLWAARRREAGQLVKQDSVPSDDHHAAEARPAEPVPAVMESAGR